MKSSNPTATAREQREFPRVNRSCDISFRILDDQEGCAAREADQPAEMKNISGGGICFSHSEPVPVKSMLALEVDLPEFPNSVIAMGQVCWCNESVDAQVFELGVEFWWVGWKDESAQQQVRTYITGLLSADDC